MINMILFLMLPVIIKDDRPINDGISLTGKVNKLSIFSQKRGLGSIPKLKNDKKILNFYRLFFVSVYTLAMLALNLPPKKSIVPFSV